MKIGLCSLHLTHYQDWCPPWEHRECHSCRKSLPIEKLFMLTISSNTLLCPDCINKLHSMTSPLSVLVTTGLDTSTKS